MAYNAMGNLCGKQSEDPFAQPGRTVGSVPPPSNNQTASLPRKVGGPARTLGGSNAKDTGDISPEEARKRAAAAAEARANATNKPKGKLGSQLEGQKKETRTETLKRASDSQRLQRDADAAAEARAYN
ncbi:hypothetical protein DH86_00003520 [Scytalidium sp. 3C]|nr:hypothetical protein DH86_00003520 [Scytalidium sp. 3C]